MPVTIVGNNTPTAGGVVYGDGTNYASTAAGTSGQVLTSAGAGVPTWATPSNIMTLISTQTVSAGSDLSWTGLSTYNSYYLVINSLYGSVNARSIYIQFGYGATPTYVGSNYYTNDIILNNNTVSGTNQTGLSAISPASQWGTTASFPIAGAFTITNTTANRPMLFGMLTGGSSTTSATNALELVSGYVGTASALTAIKITPVSGTFTGTASLYGISS